MANITRRRFLNDATCAAGVAASCGVWDGGTLRANEPPLPSVPFKLSTISGSPRERGQEYGKRFADDIRSFLDEHITRALANEPSQREAILRYAGTCFKHVEKFSPIIAEELHGMSQGTGLRVEEHVMLTLHEELYHRGVLPGADHCKVIAAGPPDTPDGHTYLGQTWEWMAGTYGRSTMLHWQRPATEGPSVLAYAYPGLWIGAGVNSAGITFGWTSAWDKHNIAGPRVGMPSYLFLAHLLYQSSLDTLIAEAKRVRHAGWFTTVFADGRGRMVNIEGSPDGISIEEGRGRMARHNYGTRRMTESPATGPVQHNEVCLHATKLLDAAAAQATPQRMKRILSSPGLCVPYNPHNFTIDRMLFDATAGKAWVVRGPDPAKPWTEFTLPNEW